MKKKINITFFSANRAEYGLIYPFIKKISVNKNFNVNLIVSGSHLDRKFGNSLDEIKKDKIKIIAKIKLPLKTNKLSEVADYFSIIQNKINKVLNLNNSDAVFISSDRFETFAFSISSYLRKIPIIHYEGGDITEGGALDDNIRHAITKLSNIHITSNKEAHTRLIKMGEEKWRCINTGYSQLNEIKNKNFSLEKIKSKFKLIPKKPLIIFTFHPLVLSDKDFLKELNETFLSLEKLTKLNYQIIITYPNFDPGFKKIISKIKDIKKKYKDIRVYKHLGRENYHQLLYYIGKTKNGVCMGNSSSGIKEAVIFSCPAINIGQRQKSRLKSDNVINVIANHRIIINKVKNNLKIKNNKIYNPYKLTNSFKNLNKILLRLLRKSNLISVC